MRALKGIVAVLGLLIITVMILIVYGMIQKSQNPDFSFFSGTTDAPLTPAAPTKQGAGRFADNAQVSLPHGGRIVSTTIGDGRLVISVDEDGTDGVERVDTLIILDLETGRELGRVKVGP